jgi:predicted MPP superfamily phosphohydrolase
LEGFTIVQLSDIPMGEYVGASELAAAHALVRQAKPDLIVLTGDLLDRDPELAPDLGAFVQKLAPLAREGVVAISGNHDFYAGIDPTCSALSRAGARVLRNDGCVIGDSGGAFARLGVDDVMGPRFGGRGADLARAKRRLPVSRDLPSVLLCHNPRYFEEAQGQVGLQLSGHTHGGQINLGVSPASLVLPHGFVAGLYQRKGSQLYVNRGFGTVGPPARIGAPPEVTRIVLRG